MAIGEAAEWIRREECAIAVAGGAEAPVNADGICHFDQLAMLTRNNADPAHAVRPFDVARDGFALSEGAAMVVLEDEDVAVRRGALHPRVRRRLRLDVRPRARGARRRERDSTRRARCRRR